MSAVVTLTTDFGLTDAYVAMMKGVILGINPEARLVDICHSIEPQNIAEAAFMLGTAYRCFSRKTVHLVVIDPGVGSQRKAIILRTSSATFVAPDNGVLSYVIQQSLVKQIKERGSLRLQGVVKPGESLEAVHITNPRFWRSPVSPTFHGRDILAPVAAALSLGFPPIEFGEQLEEVEVLPVSQPEKAKNGSLAGHIVHIDSFGNLITDIQGEEMPPAEKIERIESGKRIITAFVRAYAEGNGLIALVGSSGFLEISLKGGSAASLLEAKIGDEVYVRVKVKED